MRARDVADEAAVATVNAALQRSGRLDVLFNNAGVGMNRPFLSVPKDEFEHHVAVHLHGTVYGMRYALPAMARQGSGRIINTISRAAEFAGAKNAAMQPRKQACGLQPDPLPENSKGEISSSTCSFPVRPTRPSGGETCRIYSSQKSLSDGPHARHPPERGPHAGVYWDEAPYPMFKSLYDTGAIEP